MNTIQANLLIIIYFFSVSISKTHSESIAEVNSKVYFKPKLNYFSKEKTGLSILVIHKLETKTLNNPFLSKSGYYIDQLKGNANYSFMIDNQKYLPNLHGKINLSPFTKGKYEATILWQNQEIKIYPNIKDKHTCLQLIILGQDSLPTMIGEYNSSSVMNMAYKKVYKSLKTTQQSFLKIRNKELQLKDLIDPKYRDNLGKATDFIEYLKIHYNRLKDLKASLIRLNLLEKGYRVQIEGSISFENIEANNFHYQVSLNSNFKIISFVL